MSQTGKGVIEMQSFTCFANDFPTHLRYNVRNHIRMVILASSRRTDSGMIVEAESCSRTKFGRTMRKEETEKTASSSRFNGYENGIGRFRFDYSLSSPASFGEAGRRTRQLRAT